MISCSRCQHENATDAAFCDECGARLDTACPSCREPNRAGAKFCRKCGQGLTQTAGGSPGPAAKFAAPDSYTPKHLAEKILTSKAALEGERKQITVLFADLKGSMELLADRDPEEARKLLDPVLERMMEAVHHYEGTVNQVMGDGIMALFGAPLAHEDHAVRACYAALRMQESLKRYADDTRRSHGVEVQIRVGLNSGEVVVRSVGSDLRMDYTAVGQTTHLAARMEQLAPPGTVRLSGETLRLVEGYVEVRSLGPIPVKGLPDPIEIFELTGEGQARTRLQAAALRGLTRFVGRDAEVEHLRRVLGQAGAGRGQIVAIVGEAGVGKSRLTYEFTHSHRVQDWLILEASSVSYGKATSYLPVIELLKDYFKVGDRDDHRDMRAKVLGRVLGLDRTLEPLLSPLLGLLDVPVEDAAWQALEPPQRRHRTLDAVKRLLLRESQAQPLLVVFEDLHWIDGETQALLDSLVDSLGSAPLLLLVNYRPEYEHRWGSKTAYSQLRLDPLPAESAAALLEALLGPDPGLAPLTQMLVKRGNPFFLEETVRTLVETGALAGERGAYRLTRPVETLQVPATVQTILAARIDRLSAAEKQLLHAASVIGKHVSFALLAAIAEHPEEALRRELAHLQEAEFLYETQLFPDLEYTFKHALTHEVTYGTLLQARRRALHTRVVDAIEASYPTRLTEHVERLAHHALAAEEWARAARYCYTAGERAMGQARYATGATFFEATIRALDSQGEGADRGLKLDACLELWVTRIETGQPEGLQELGETLDALASALDDRPRLAQVRVRQAQGSWIVWCGPGGLPTAIERAREAFDLADPTDLRTRSYARFLVGAASLALGRFGDAVREFDAGVEEFTAAPAGIDTGLVIPIRASLRTWQAEAYAALGDFRDAIASAAEARKIAETIGHPQSRWFAAAAAGYVLLTKGDVAAAARAYADGLAGAEEHELVAGTYVLSLGLANCQFLLGQREDGMKTLPRDVNLFATPGPGLRNLCRYGSLTASAYLAAGLLREAQAEIARGLALATTDDAATYLVPLTRLHAEALALAGPEHHDEAIGCWQRAIDTATALGMRPELARCHLGLGKRLRATGAPERAREHLGTATTLCRALDMPFWLEQAEAEIREQSSPGGGT